MTYEELQDPDASGVEVMRAFASDDELGGILSETNDPEKVQWIDAHEVYQNNRGLTIVQNHFTYALNLVAGSQDPVEKLPHTMAMKEKIQRFVTGLSSIFPTLAEWNASELSFHLYDDSEIGLSRHRDNMRFIGMIAILTVDGECDLVIGDSNNETAITVRPGDLTLLRAPGLIQADQEIRPEHSVRNITTGTRLSMMLRHNQRPQEVIPGFRFNNWSPEESSV